MKFLYKKFHDLSLEELFEIYLLRNKVFVVEQNCPYQDVDSIDKKAIHILLTEKKVLLAYCRIYLIKNFIQIGRVVVAKDSRGKGYGKKIMKKAINEAKFGFRKKTIMVSAQKYLLKFYSDFGFKKTGREFLEDGIPHVKMLLKQAN